MSGKVPAFQFYPADWRKDPAIQSLSFNDRAIVFETLCIMHESSDRGKLLLNGKPMSMKVHARLLGCDEQTLSNALSQILESGALKMDANGVLYSSRMVRDEETRKQRVEAGKRGGNPALLKQIDKPQDNALPFRPPKQTGEGEVEDESLSRVEGKGEGFEVEPPPGFPTSVEAAAAMSAGIVFQTVGKPARVITPLFVADNWKEVKARRWRDRQGNVISSWRSYIDVAWSRRCQWEDRNPGRTFGDSERPKTITELRTIKEAKEKIARELENRWTHEAATGREWTDTQKRQMWRDLQKEIKDLNSQIANFK